MGALGEGIRDFFRRQERRNRSFRKMIPSRGRIIELGCGEGSNLRDIRKYRPEVELHGVDLLDPGGIPDFIQYKVSDLDGSSLPYPDGHFDAVLLVHVLEHLEHPFRLGSEIHRIMKTGAGIYVETPNWTTMLVPSFGFRRDQHNPFNFFDDPTHRKPWTRQALFEFMTGSCRLRDVEIGSCRNFARLPVDPFWALWGLLSGNRAYIVGAFWNWYGWSIYGVGTKT